MMKSFGYYFNKKYKEEMAVAAGGNACNLEDLLITLKRKFEDLETIERKYGSKNVLVHQAYLERKADYNEFKIAVNSYNLKTSIYAISAQLKQTGKYPHRIYGGICLNGEGYFKLSEQIMSTLDIDNEEELVVTSRDEMYPESIIVEDEDENLDSGYNILDEE